MLGTSFQQGKADQTWSAGGREVKTYRCAARSFCDLPASPSCLSRDSSVHLSSTEEKEEAYLEAAEGRKVLREEGGGKLLNRRKRKKGKEDNLWKAQPGPLDHEPMWWEQS